MPGSWDPAALPNLTASNWVCKSPWKNKYNCIAWAAGDDQNFWWPGAVRGYWPPGVPREETVDAFVLAFETRGYVKCADASVEEGYEKIALFAQRVGNEEIPAHAARQLSDGRWTSKIGRAEDIEHDTLEAVNCADYGKPVLYMKRPR